MTAFEWANEDSKLFMSRGYTDSGETVEQRVRDIANTAAKFLGNPKFADKFYDYVGRGWFSLSSPVWANFGKPRGLSISCNGSYVGDSMDLILRKTAESGMMAKHGAGTSSYWDLRPRGTPISAGGTADGPVHFMRLRDTAIDVISQGNVRRGSEAEYLDIDHPDFYEFMECREEGSPIQNLSLGVCVSDAFMKRMIAGEEEARKRWLRVLRKRFESGYPYIFWTDTVNNNKPEVYKDLGYKIHASNLCSEICLPSDNEESFVCNLSSMNLLKWDEWKDTDAVVVLTMFLDAVMEEYIQKTATIPFMEDAHRFAYNHRALGLGVLGWHSLLQSKMIPFESFEAKLLNVEIHKFVSAEALKASKMLAELLGEPPVLKDYGRRNTTLMAIAPTTSSSFILGQVSPSIEPLASNYFTKDLAKGKFTYRNPYLADVLEQHGRNDEETWRSILQRGGSVQHLDFLTDHERDVFKTFGEISQLEIIQQAAARQKFIDQSQSLNLMIHPNTPLKDLNALMITAWELGVKTLYYQRSTNPAQELARTILTCSSCEA